MIQIVYFIFFWALIFQVVIFVLLSIASPLGIKGKIISLFTTHKSVGYILYFHLAFCILAAFFFLDLSQEEKHFLQEKQTLRINQPLGYELRVGFLSYTILKIQRNKYIAFMFIYTSIALNIFIQLLKHIYSQTSELKKIRNSKKRQEKVDPPSIQSKYSRSFQANSRQSDTDKRSSNNSWESKKIK